MSKPSKPDAVVAPVHAALTKAGFSLTHKIGTRHRYEHPDVKGRVMVSSQGGYKQDGTIGYYPNPTSGGMDNAASFGGDHGMEGVEAIVDWAKNHEQKKAEHLAIKKNPGSGKKTAHDAAGKFTTGEGK